MSLPNTFENLIQLAQSNDLYEKLIAQLNKDLQFSNISESFSLSTSPEQLKVYLREILHGLILNDFNRYVNFLYTVDVSEEKIRKFDGSEALQLAQNVTFLVLQREWQKVWFRNSLA